MERCRQFCAFAVVLFFGANALAAVDDAPVFDTAQITLCEKPAPPASLSVAGFSLIADDDSPQVALMQRPTALVASLRAGEVVSVEIPVRSLTGRFTVSAELTSLGGGETEVAVAVDKDECRRTMAVNESVRLEATGNPSSQTAVLCLAMRARIGEPTIRWRRIRLTQGNRSFDVAIVPAATAPDQVPPPVLPAMRRPIKQALIEWDWRMQDGIETERMPSTYAAAIEKNLNRGDELLCDLRAGGDTLVGELTMWQALRAEWQQLAGSNVNDESRWEDLWRRVHSLRRRIALANPLVRQMGPLVFAKQCPSSFSHQLTQYVGRFARPGGGIFVLESPGETMACRQLAAGALPIGSYQHPDVSFDGSRVLFSFCPVEKASKSWNEHADRTFHVYEVSAHGSGLRRLSDGPYNDFSPRYLPNGQIVFISTRRGGWHRCGGRPGEGCENHTLAVANADGSDARPISFHETQEWDPSVLDDGRVIFTRWDYVDRHAVFYQQLWTVRPDGNLAASYYGNNTFNPVGIWEARQVPGSRRVIATAGAHHAMTAGSIILVDGSRVVDGPAAITRLTPDALFPESETRVLPGGWHAPVGVTQPVVVPSEAQRWPGHCYRSPYPLSEKYFLAAYSFDSLIGEPQANPVNMFGIYLVDAFGNKELLYRDLNIASLWPIPLRPRPRPPTIQSQVELFAESELRSESEGKFFLQNVYESWPPVPDGSVKRLRIVQVLPKSTPGANFPRVGLANASPGKQVLGTVPVEADGSAYFRAPAGVPLAFQALDEHGQAVQVMRSVTYVQPGETRSCVGCHERRTMTSRPADTALAVQRLPSQIEPGPDGSNPLSYPLLVQPVLNRHCVRCHNREKPDGGLILTGEPDGGFTRSYNALASRVTYSDWAGRGGDFRLINSEPISTPGFFGAMGSPLMHTLLEGHHDVALNADDIGRLATWMDANALFYGTFDHDDQSRQLRGERITEAKLK